MPKPADKRSDGRQRPGRAARCPLPVPGPASGPRRQACWRVVAAALLVGGCASAPVVRWHSLSAPADVPAAPLGNAVSAAAAGATRWLVQLTVLRVPAAVDQPQWLVRLPDDTLRLLEDERWAAPLRDELRAALVQGLVARWGAADAGGRPFEPTTDAIRDTLPQPAEPGPPSPNPAPPRPAGAAAAASPVPEPRRVTVDVARFESLPEREAVLDAGWTIAVPPRAGEPPAPLLACRSAFREPVGSGAAALAAGHRRAVAALADVIGRALQAGRDTACPATAPQSR